MDPVMYPLFWLILALVLGIVEAVTVQLVAIWLALGALVAIVPALLQAPMWVQVAVFLLASVLALIFTRPFVQKVLHVKRQRTNADSVIGTTGLVTETIDNDHEKGRVLAGGLSWAARSEYEDTVIPEGQKVEILRIAGVKLIVRQKI